MALKPAGIDGKRVAELTEREEKRLQNETPKSYEMFKRASKSLVNGVSSTYQVRDPYPIYFTHGKGSKIYSVSGREISDFHNGFGCMVRGHPSGHRQYHQETKRAQHAVLAPHRGFVHRGRAPSRELSPAQVALRELGV